MVPENTTFTLLDIKDTGNFRLIFNAKKPTFAEALKNLTDQADGEPYQVDMYFDSLIFLTGGYENANFVFGNVEIDVDIKVGYNATRPNPLLIVLPSIGYSL